jgi:anti-sigma regulatory factor (Ser/Thr protein kinase)
MKVKTQKIHAWITRATVAYPHDLAKAFSEQFGVTRATAATWLRKLVAEDWVRKDGTTRPIWSPGPRRLLVSRYSLPDLEETLCWTRDFAPYLALPDRIADIAHYGFTEMLNNAIDHSGGEWVRVGVMQTATRLYLYLHDNGIGVFERIATGLKLPDRRLSLLELSKGKCTTDPSRHTGEGIFFTSRVFDRFTLEANDLQFVHDIALNHDWLREQDDSDLRLGTRLRMTIRLDSIRTLRAVFDQYTDSDEWTFTRTIIPVRLARLGNENLLSRSQAKRVIHRFDQFKTVILDFEGITDIGQAFADEVFRVFASAHPELSLTTINASPCVMSMINRVTK